MRISVQSVLCLSLVFSPVTAADETGVRKATDLAEFKSHVRPFLAEYCVSCHGEKKQKAKFALHDIDGLITGGKDAVRWEKILEMISLGDMPPEDETQPPKIDRARIQTWIASELRKIGRGQDEGKLALPNEANRIPHEELFSGEHRGPASSPARLWRKSPQIYDRFAGEMRTTVSQPLLGLGGKGIQDYASLFADESTIKTMMRNCDVIAESLIGGERPRFNYLPKNGDEPSEEIIERAIKDLFKLIFQRELTDNDRQRYVAGLFEKNRKLGGFELGYRSLITGMLLSPEFVFRLELGLGEELDDGRKMLAPQEIAYALCFAFYDKPDAALIGAANGGKLATKEDVAREVRRILDTPDTAKRYWNYPMYHQWGNDYYHEAPRILRFFQEFFGYTAAADVFKDAERNPDHHANRLRKDADMFVLHILERDKDVFAELLTSNRYPIDYFENDKMKKLLEGGNQNQLDHYKEKYGDEFESIAESGKWPGIDTKHVSAYNIDKKQADTVRRAPGDLIVFPKDQRAGMLTHPAWLVAHSGNFDNDPIRRGKWIREHLLAGTLPDLPIGVDARVPENPHKTLRERLEIVEAEQCWRCHRKMNPLGIAFEHYDDFGRYRDQIVLRDADAYFKEKRRYEQQKEKTESDLAEWESLDAKARTAKVAHAEKMLAHLKEPETKMENHKAAKRNYENDVKRWTKEQENWLKVDDAEQQRRVADLKRRLTELVEPVPDAVPVDARGELSGTGDPDLDGPVEDGIELSRRLGKSERVRQSFVRHAFRYWMGRNETLDDSPTLIAADKAYVENGGSFKAMLVSLLTSDSFLYRR